MPKLDPRKVQLLQDLFAQGNSLLQQKDFEGASFSYEAILEIEPRNFDALHMLGVAHSAAGQHEKGAPLIKRALSIDPQSAAAHLNYGIVMKELGQFELAVKHQKTATLLQSKNPNTHYNLANTLRDAGNIQEAIDSYRQTLRLKPDHIEALNNLKGLLIDCEDFPRAAECCAQLIRCNSGFPNLHGQLRHLRAQCCDWKNYDEDCAEILQRVEQGEAATIPFSILSFPSTAKQQKQCAQTGIRLEFPVLPEPLWNGERYQHSRIRIGYFSADFFAHATAFLMAELFEKHDRKRFEIFIFSFGNPAPNPMRDRLIAGVEHFIEVSELSDVEIAQLARQYEIDIAIDLKGLTQWRRTGLFAYRCAPIQINYLGYPGTMGAPFIDYIVADHTIIPAGLEDDYSEKVLRLPNSYQPNDTLRRIAAETPGRREHGLPESGFVFCCFNNNFKITPDVFDIWMRLLAAVKDSVLWLFKDNEAAAENLRKEATRRGIATERLVFAPRLPLAEHLARHRHADLFLDTFYCNAHTTASDALWAGLPLLTCIGNTFASRVAASLLTAVGQSGLITHSPEEYESMALKFANAPHLLTAIRQELNDIGRTSSLFDSTRYVRNIETGYQLIWNRYQSDEAPAHLDIPV